MIIIFYFIVVLYLAVCFYLLYFINKQKHRIYELSDMNDSLYKELETMRRDNFKNNIRVFREGMGYTQTDLAELIGTSRNSISSMENQEYQPTAYTAYKLCRCLGVTFEQLFYWED